MFVVLLCRIFQMSSSSFSFPRQRQLQRKACKVAFGFNWACLPYHMSKPPRAIPHCRLSSVTQDCPLIEVVALSVHTKSAPLGVYSWRHRTFSGRPSPHASPPGTSVFWSLLAYPASHTQQVGEALGMGVNGQSLGEQDGRYIVDNQHTH